MSNLLTNSHNKWLINRIILPMSIKTLWQYFMPSVQSVAWTETARARVLATRVDKSFIVVDVGSNWVFL